jgi:hypothetical protein
MPLNDWMAHYPQVQALLQQEGEVLAYAVEGEGDAARASGRCLQCCEAWPSDEGLLCQACFAEALLGTGDA